jgi:PAS domain S-box-containing protein
MDRPYRADSDESAVTSAILGAVRSLVAILGADGEIIRCNRACEEISGYAAAQIIGKQFWELLMTIEDGDRSRELVYGLGAAGETIEYESELVTVAGDRRLIAWSNTVLADAMPPCIVVTGIDITERKRMEQAILDVSAREQRKIGRDLHDGLGQHLTGIAFMSKVLEQKLSSRTAPEESADAAKIVQLVNEAINKTRELARGLLPVVSDADGLMGALKLWAAEVEDLFHVRCEFVCGEPVLVDDVAIATHLYHIAQESVNNALRHASPRHIVITVERKNELGTLSIEDDGIGMPAAPAKLPGLGRHIMSYRASMIGGSLEVTGGRFGGTAVRCRFPVKECARA